MVLAALRFTVAPEHIVVPVAGTTDVNAGGVLTVANTAVRVPSQAPIVALT